MWFKKKRARVFFHIQSIEICCFDWHIWQRYVVEQRRNILLAFLRSLSTFFFNTTTKFHNSSFLKNSFDVEFETTSMNLSFSVTLKSISILFFEEIFYQGMICNIMHWCTKLYRTSKFWHILLIQYKKKTKFFNVVSPSSSKKF